MSKYRSTWHLEPENLDEFTNVFVVRYRDPLNKKRFAIPYKDQKSANDKMAQLKRDGVKEIEVTKDMLRGNIKFKEEVDLLEFTSSQMNMLKKSYGDLKGKTISPQKATALSKHLDRLDVPQLKQLVSADMPFVSTLAKNKLYKKTGKFEDTDQERLAKLRTRQMELQMKVRNMDQGDPKTKTPMAIAKNDIENIQMRMDQIKDRARRKSMNEEGDHEISMARGELEAISDKALELSSALEGMSDEGNPLEAWVQSKITKAKDYINSVSDYLMYNPDIKMNEEIKSDDDYQAKKKALQDIQNNPKMRDPETKAALMKRKDKLDKDYADFKSKDKIAASKEFEKDLAAEADLTKGQIKKVHKMADELPKKDFKDRYGKEKGDSVRYATATNIVKKKEGIKEMQQIDEKIEGLKNKSEKSGIPYGILKQVYNRGMAAWKGGHRPGTTPQQWAFARVNAFITKGKAYYTADADLAKKARAAKKGKK